MITIDHIVLSVADPQRLMPFYAALGFTPVVFKDGFFIVVGKARLFFFTSAPGAPQGHLDHLAFGVPRGDLADLLGRLREMDVETRGIETFAATGTPYIAFRDPCGVPAEFWGADGPKARV